MLPYIFMILCFMMLSVSWTQAFSISKNSVLGRNISKQIGLHGKTNKNVKMSLETFSEIVAMESSNNYVTLMLSADSGSQTAVAVPIVISFLTIIPFIYYAQALKPKERTIRQIEVDPNTLKAMSSKDSKGSISDKARATKK